MCPDDIPHNKLACAISTKNRYYPNKFHNIRAKKLLLLVRIECIGLFGFAQNLSIFLINLLYLNGE